MILLITLGTYSVCSLFIVWTSISRRVALTLFGAVALLGIAAGFTANVYHGWEMRRMLDIFDSEVLAAAPSRVPVTVTATHGSIGADRSDTAGQPENITVSRVDHLPRNESPGPLFTRIEGHRIGLTRPNHFSVNEFWPPFYNGRGIASGDVDNDGWPDIVSASKEGVLLYHNDAGKEFVEQSIDVPGLEKMNVFLVALIDINDDGWLDLYFTTYLKGNFYVLNEGGKFTERGFHTVPHDGSVLTYSAAFGDIDRDGDLDAVLGNWFYGFSKPVPPPSAQNKILINRNGEIGEQDRDGAFVAHDLPGITGETLSVLLSDFNDDQNLDLLVGNDFVQPDIFYYGDGKGGFQEITRQDHIIPISTTTTMSIDTADINNDLRLDIYVAQISARATGKAARLRLRRIAKYCSDIIDPDDKAVCDRNIAIRRFFHFGGRHKPSDISHCKVIKVKSERKACAAMMFMKTTIRERDKSLCERIPESQGRAAVLCNNYFEASVKTTGAEYARSIPQSKNQNVLLMATGDDTFVDQAEMMEVETTGWSWNAKIADFDNDEWQDIYVVNGTWLRADATPSNIYFSNQQGKKFLNQTVESGLEDYVVVSAYTYVDIDNDGDLDIITNTVNGPIKAYINNESKNNAIAFELRDHKGNRFGIGSKVIIYYGDDGATRQIREIKSGGGFISFDAPVAHFGLGKKNKVARVDIVWSTGERTEIRGDFPAGATYRIERPS